MADQTESSPSKVGFSLKTLRRITILKDLSDEKIVSLEAACRWQDFAKDDVIVDRDDQSGEVYFIARGSVRVVTYGTSGGQVGFASYGAGNLFGELAAVDGMARSATVFAEEKTITAIMDRSTFIDLVKDSNQVSLRLLIHFSQVIRSMNDRVRDLTTVSDVQRVYHELLRLAEPSPEGDGSWMIFHMPRHKELASLVETTPDVVAHAVSQLMKEGLVKRRASTLELLDRIKIQRLAIM